MTSNKERKELHRQIWKISNDVRGTLDGWDFKQYMLGTLFYRFVSEDFTKYIEDNHHLNNYAQLEDSAVSAQIKDEAIKAKGYFIYPNQLFSNVAAAASSQENLGDQLAHIFNEIESSANGYPSEPKIKGIFADFDTNSNRIGGDLLARNALLTKILTGVADIEFGPFNESKIDLFGDAYEFLISNYAANAGKSGGEFFTPQCISSLIAKIALHNKTSVNKIYDPTAGSGSLLLQAKKQFDQQVIKDGFFGQELNPTTHNLARMNMLLHGVSYDKLNIAQGDTLINPKLKDAEPYDAIVSNPPYSVKWIGKDDPNLVNDERFSPAGALAPKSKADLAFVMHALSCLSDTGRAAIVCFPGIFYRSGEERKIRKYLVENNYVEALISLPNNLFFSTSIAVTVLVLSKNKTSKNIQFINASGEGFFKKAANNNFMEDGHIATIMELFDRKENAPHVAASVPLEKIAANDYNLSVSSYVEAKETKEAIDINELNAEIKTTVVKIDQLRTDIDAIIAEIDA